MTAILSAVHPAANFVFALLLAIVGMLFVTFIVLALMICQRAKADGRRAEKYVYVRKTDDKTTDCANKQTEDASGTVKNKMRHGKKNKVRKIEEADV